MESNDKLNLQNDKEIEKIIPFDLGMYTTTYRQYLILIYRAYIVFRQDIQNQ
jgi:hypothetical protein